MSGERPTMTVAEVSEYLGLSTRHIYEQVRRGDFPALRIGHRILIPRRAVDEMIERACAVAPQEGEA